MTVIYMGIFLHLQFLLYHFISVGANRNFPNNIEIDVSWDFEGNDYEGWASATAEEMQVVLVI